ncbi:MAG: ABC transporter ATP-binding protein [Phycisphaerales bacterium]|nr:ATP-binding cassette domain-containing protein [Phycisphaerales bacterium]GIK20166.1 MAG: ABC transporter [Planctomycetota bacterium]
MPLLAAANLRLHYGNAVILDGCSISVEAGERVGVVGRNGTGKTSLLRVLAGSLPADSGDVNLQRGTRAGYLAQVVQVTPGRTVREEAASAFEELSRLHHELDALFHDMAGAHGDALPRFMRRQEELERRIEAAGGYVIDHRVDAVLHGLGFTDAQFSLMTDVLSGGQKARLALARLLLEDPDLLLLDEPTNHLDIDGREWLETFLRDDFRGAVVMVSHDRRLLDNVVSRIVEVEAGRLIEYPGNYAKFRELRAERRLTQMRAYERQQTRFRKEEEYIRRFKAGQRAKQARGRETRLDREKADGRLERPAELATFQLELPRAERSGDVVASARALGKRYRNDDGSQRVLFHDLDVTIGRGERWGVIGPNGAGKTTLVRCLLGEIAPDTGTVRIGSKVIVGYLRQVHDDADPDLTVVEYLKWAVARESGGRTMSEQESRDLAGAFLFSGEEQDKHLRSLSGGERSRAALAAMLASAKNLLVLDEPTNHLDIPSAERLEDALAPEGGYDGTLILISHDRALIDALCDRLLVLDGRGGAEIFIGNYSEWLVKRARSSNAATPAPETIEQRADAARQTTPTRTPPPDTSKPTNAARSRFSWMSVERIEDRLGELQAEIAALDQTLAEPATWRDPEKSASLQEQRGILAAEVEELEAEWLRKAE